LNKMPVGNPIITTGLALLEPNSGRKPMQLITKALPRLLIH
jgi:hypothetical protein